METKTVSVDTNHSNSRRVRYHSPWSGRSIYLWATSNYDQVYNPDKIGAAYETAHPFDVSTTDEYKRIKRLERDAAILKRGEYIVFMPGRIRKMALKVICDKCNKILSPTDEIITTFINNKGTGEQYDFCMRCHESFIYWLASKEEDSDETAD